MPVLGYIFLRGQCVRCGGWIAPRYFITELGLGLAAVYLYPELRAARRAGPLRLCAALFAVSWVDLDWRIIPDVISLPGIAVGLAAASLVMREVGWQDSLLGMALGGGLFYAVGEAYRWLRGREGMGMGDVKLWR